MRDNAFMRNELQFVAPMTGFEAAQRAQYVLGLWKYRFWSIPGGVRFERSLPLAGLMVIHPHHVHSRIDLLLSDLADGTCQVFVKQQVFKFGQPSSNLDKVVWQGDVEDLEAALLRREEPRIDRNQQNAYAGKTSIKYILIIVIPTLVAAAWVGIISHNAIGAFVLLLFVIFSVIVLPYLPFKMPPFPIENRIPPPPFESNYLRSGKPK